MDWKLRETGFWPERNEDNGNRFLIGNGYLGVRGTLEEFTKEQLAAINLSGIYDQVGDGWREPLNAPNGLYALLQVEGESFHVMERTPAEHELLLNYREGILYRKTAWNTERGSVLLQTERFAEMENPHFLYQRYEVTSDYDCRICVTTGIDGDVWDIYGPHYCELLWKQEKDALCAEASVQEKRETVWVREKLARPEESRQITEEEVAVQEKKILRRISCLLKAGQPLTLFRQIGIETSQDKEAGGCLAGQFSAADYETRKKEQIAHWEAHWQQAAVIIEGDDEAMAALNYSLYHLHSIAPRHSESLSIPARGLSGQTYKGAVFWDTEMFMLPFFLYTNPAVARTLLKYRIDTLPGAIKKAGAYGYEGAFYAWESQEGGFDACSDYNVTDVFTGRPMRTYFRDKQIHISSAIVYGLMNYVKVSGDTHIWSEGGLETVLECARFYYGLLVKRVSGECYELWDVIGPDEYHERVNNNGYTNRMARYTFESACSLLEQLEQAEQSGRFDLFDQETISRIKENYPVAKWKEDFSDAAVKLYLPEPDSRGVIEQFDGYHKLEEVSVEEVKSRLLHEKEYWGGAYGVASETKVIKQADVVTWLTLFAKEFDLEILKSNFHYYEPYTEHGSSLSACMYAWLACLCGMPDRAYPFFLKSAMADWKGGGKQWAGLVYIGGSHPAAAGGAYMTAIHGFAGVSVAEGIRLEPKFPAHWKKMKFSIHVRNVRYDIEIEKEKETYKVRTLSR